MEEMMNRDSPENYYNCEIKVCSSPFPSPLTIPAIVTQEPKDSSPELYFTSDVKVTLSPYTSPMTVPTLRQMNNSPFLNSRSSYHEESGSFHHQEQLQQSSKRHSMYETASSCSTHQSQSMQSTTFQQQHTIPPIQKAPTLQPLGGRADVTAQPDQDDPCSSVSSQTLF